MKLRHTIKEKAVKVLNEIFAIEMTGVIRYTHYSLIVVGYNRIPIVKWMQSQAQESLDHATQAGEMITTYEEHPTLLINNIVTANTHSIPEIFTESLTHEKLALEKYYELLEITTNKCIILEEYAKRLIVEEENHIIEVEKMQRV